MRATAVEGASTDAAGHVSATARRALWLALVDAYQHPFRLMAMNAALAGTALAVLWAASHVQAALLLLVALGPLAAGVMHAAVTLVRDEELRLADAVDGMRRHWRRGLALALLVAGAAALGVVAVRFYAEAGRSLWPLAILAAYGLALFLLLQVLVWPAAVAAPERPLRAVYLGAALRMLSRPVPLLGLGAALLALNVVGAALVLPLLTLTISYSFIAAARFALPPPSPEEVHERWRG